MEWINVPDEGLTLRDIRRITKRDQAETAGIRESVEQIIADVQQRGDEAVRELTEKFDGVRLDTFRVSPEEIEEAFEGRTRLYSCPGRGSSEYTGLP